MSFFSKFKEIYSKINEVEHSIYGGRRSYQEIYERNLQLENEIQQRTSELNLANKRLLSLQNIWDMMNSSEPLQSVLETIVGNLQGEFGYLHSMVARKLSDVHGEYLQVEAGMYNAKTQKINQLSDGKLQHTRLNFDPNGIFAKSLREKGIRTTRNIRATIKHLIPDLPEDKIKQIVPSAGKNAIISIPLFVQHRPFGVFAIVSPRAEISNAEKDFLTMYARQIETAINISDLFKAVKEQAITDGLTGLYNRRYFEEQLGKEASRAQRQGQPFSVIGLDLDYLKQINDKFGHSFGDLAIRTVADVLKKTARTIDIAARMGGEEFNILLPGIESEGAAIAAERIRKALEECELDTIGKITASVGVATFLEHSDNVDEVLELTDQAMYQSKRDGRNRVTIAKPLTETSWQEIAVSTFADILAKHNIPIPKDLTKDLQAKLKQPDTGKEALYAISDLLIKSYNPAHNTGVAKLKNLMAVTLAKRFDLPKDEVDNLRVAMLLYDIGNLMLPKEILQKKGPLTDKEKQAIKEHPLIAAREILNPISHVQDVIPIIESHHENWDGTGYPRKKAKSEIPLASQIVLIIDSYFALMEKRPYRDKLSPADALAMIQKDADKKWNATLVQEFVVLVEQENTIAASLNIA